MSASKAESALLVMPDPSRLKARTDQDWSSALALQCLPSSPIAELDYRQTIAGGAHEVKNA